MKIAAKEERQRRERKSWDVVWGCGYSIAVVPFLPLSYENHTNTVKTKQNKKKKRQREKFLTSQTKKPLLQIIEQL